MSDQQTINTPPLNPTISHENQEDVVDIDVKGIKVWLTAKGIILLSGLLIILIGGAVLLTSQFNLLGCQHESVKVKIQKQVK